MTDEETNKKLDALIALLTPKAIDPNVKLIKTAEGISREDLKDKFPKDKLDSWDLKQLKMAKDVQAAKILPDPISKDDTTDDKKGEEEEEQEEEKEDTSNSADDLFKFSSKTLLNIFTRASSSSI